MLRTTFSQHTEITTCSAGGESTYEPELLFQVQRDHGSSGCEEWILLDTEAKEDVEATWGA